jgi:hypothetical protein
MEALFSAAPSFGVFRCAQLRGPHPALRATFSRYAGEGVGRAAAPHSQRSPSRPAKFTRAVRGAAFARGAKKKASRPTP